MYVDSTLLFAERKPLAAGAFGDVVDLGKSGIDQGAGTPVSRLAILAITAVSGATINLVTSDTPDLATETVLMSTGAITIPAGSFAFAGPIPSTEKYKRYLGLKVTAGTGTVTAFLTSDTPAMRLYFANPA